MEFQHGFKNKITRNTDMSSKNAYLFSAMVAPTVLRFRKCCDCRTWLQICNFGKSAKWIARMCLECRNERARLQRLKNRSRRPEEVPDRKIKWCPACQRERENVEFGSDVDNYDGRSKWCIECTRISQKAKRDAIREKNENEMPIQPEMKTCHGCGWLRDSAAFPRNITYEDALHTHCLECQNDATKQWYAKNRQKIIQVKKGGVCVDCGIIDPEYCFFLFSFYCW
jgi:hypothetical protein